MGSAGGGVTRGAGARLRRRAAAERAACAACDTHIASVAAVRQQPPCPGARQAARRHSCARRQRGRGGAGWALAIERGRCAGRVSGGRARGGSRPAGSSRLQGGHRGSARPCPARHPAPAPITSTQPAIRHARQPARARPRQPRRGSAVSSFADTNKWRAGWPKNAQKVRGGSGAYVRVCVCGGVEGGRSARPTRPPPQPSAAGGREGGGGAKGKGGVGALCEQ